MDCDLLNQPSDQRIGVFRDRRILPIKEARKVIDAFLQFRVLRRLRQDILPLLPGSQYRCFSSVPGSRTARPWTCIPGCSSGHACHNRTVNETLLEQVVINAINRVLCQKDDFLQTLRANITTVVLQGDALSPEVIDERLNKLQKELLKKVNQKDD